MNAVGTGRLDAERAAKFCCRIASLCLTDTRFSDFLQLNCVAALTPLVNDAATSVSEAEEKLYYQVCRLVGFLARSDGLLLSASTTSTDQLMRELQKVAQQRRDTSIGALADDLASVVRAAWRDHAVVLQYAVAPPEHSLKDRAVAEKHSSLTAADSQPT